MERVMIIGEMLTDKISFKPRYTLSFGVVDDIKGILVKQGPTFDLSIDKIVDQKIDLLEYFGDKFIWKDEFMRLPATIEPTGDLIKDADRFIHVQAQKEKGENII